MMIRLTTLLLLGTTLAAQAGQAPFAASAPDIPISGKDRFYTSDQFSNTVSVIDPAEGKLLGVIRLGDPTPGNLSPLYQAASCWCTAWASRPTARRWPSSRSGPTPSASSTPQPTP